MLIRVARVDDIKQIQLVRMAVIENALSDSSKVNVNDYFEFLTTRGRGWACEINKEIVGFSIVDFERNSIWALFVKPEFEQKGIGRRLHNTMLSWYFAQTQENVWLTTSAGTRAELFYVKSGWSKVDVSTEGEIKFEMTYDCWRKLADRDIRGIL
jgi:GNAT superfamily N-acetyltransferase